MTDVQVASDPSALAELAVRRLKTFLGEEGPFSMLLAGGSTPHVFHRRLASDPEWPWWRTAIGFGDERCVAPSHEDSNYRAAKESLLSKVAPAAVLRMPGENPNPEAGARQYAAMLSGLPELSVAVLGMGADGHTASLFPGFEPEEGLEVCLAPEPEGAKHRRLTVTYRLLERCRVVMVLVSGEAKAEALGRVLAGENLPLARVLAARSGRPSVILADRAAALALPESMRTEDDR